MNREDRLFYGRLLMVFGPLFILGGWLAAFTLVGAVLIFAGALMLLAAPLLLWSLRGAVLAAALLVAGFGWPYVVVG